MDKKSGIHFCCKGYFFYCKLLCISIININFYPNALTVYTTTNGRRSCAFHMRQLCQGSHLDAICQKIQNALISNWRTLSGWLKLIVRIDVFSSILTSEMNIRRTRRTFNNTRRKLFWKQQDTVMCEQSLMDQVINILDCS